MYTANVHCKCTLKIQSGGPDHLGVRFGCPDHRGAALQTEGVVKVLQAALPSLGALDKL